MEELEEELSKCEVVLGELLRMALKLDYMDEIGRRKVFTVVSELLLPVLSSIRPDKPSQRTCLHILSYHQG
jgi:hypothetical protein